MHGTGEWVQASVGGTGVCHWGIIDGAAARAGPLVSRLEPRVKEGRRKAAVSRPRWLERHSKRFARQGRGRRGVVSRYRARAVLLSAGQRPNGAVFRPTLSQCTHRRQFSRAAIHHFLLDCTPRPRRYSLCNHTLNQPLPRTAMAFIASEQPRPA